MENEINSAEEAQALLDELRRLRDSAEVMLHDTHERIKHIESLLQQAEERGILRSRGQWGFDADDDSEPAE